MASPIHLQYRSPDCNSRKACWLPACYAGRIKTFNPWKYIYSPYAKVLVKMSVRHLCNTTLQRKFIYYTTTTSRILFKIELQSL